MPRKPGACFTKIRKKKKISSMGLVFLLRCWNCLDDVERRRSQERIVDGRKNGGLGDFYSYTGGKSSELSERAQWVKWLECDGQKWVFALTMALPMIPCFMILFLSFLDTFGSPAQMEEAVTVVPAITARWYCLFCCICNSAPFT